MSVGNLLSVQPSELQFPIELRKRSSCSLHFTNKSDKHVAFKVKINNYTKYSVRPNPGIIMPGTSCNVIVTMRAPEEIPDMQRIDKFLIQSTVVPDGASSKDTTPDTFVKRDGKIVEEFKLRVVYIPANPPLPVNEQSEQDLSPRSPLLEIGNWDASHLETAPVLDQPGDKSSECRKIMSVGNLLIIHPSELQFPIELRKRSSCSMHFTNKSDKHVVYKVKINNYTKYSVRPNPGIIMPGTSCNVIVTMRAPEEIPDMQCKDKFLIQSTVVPDGASSKDITPDTFVERDGKIVEEFKLRVVYIPVNPPPPVPKVSEKDLFSRSPLFENHNWDDSHLETAPMLDHPGDRSSETWSTISKSLMKKLTVGSTTNSYNSNWIRQRKKNQKID